MTENHFSNYLFNSNSKKKPGLNRQQIDVLMQIYAINVKPTTLQRIEIARNLNVPEDKVKNWFQNKRAKDKKIREETGEEEHFIFNGITRLDNTIIVFPSCNDLYRKKPNYP